MRISSKVTYILPYTVFIIHGISHYFTTATPVTEDDDLQTKDLLTSKIEAPSNAKANTPVWGMLSEEEVELSFYKINHLLESNHGNDVGVSFEANDAGPAADFNTTTHDVAMQVQSTVISV